MEVVAPPPPPLPPSTMDFNFDSSCSSPYITAPSSPQRFGNLFFSAPTSPTRTVNAPQTNTNTDPIEDDFEFDFSGHLQRPSLSADELFHGGKIRPLKPPSPVSNPNKSSSNTREQKRVVEESRRKSVEESTQPQKHKQGRERASSFSIPSRTKTASPSNRKGGGTSSVCECDDDVSGNGNTKASETAAYSSFLSSISFTKGYRKWRIKDFLLFRSASEGRATDKDPLRKYAVLSKTTAHEDVRNSSFRSAESAGSMSRRRGPVSAHELHYTVNRAVSEELKKKTPLPYKQGFLGCLGFNTGMHHITTRINGSFERS
ncbi:hypothetical protein VNO77_42209 [Canavalia gladiata]|uniref:Uncharacterized protein n=1 Tax=Canavalia gladiata TaxID=3824 RepID=A0AAN9JZU0_CANGL